MHACIGIYKYTYIPMADKAPIRTDASQNVLARLGMLADNTREGQEASREVHVHLSLGQGGLG